ncbi:DUF2599 domain-containing protein [Pseudomonas sp. S75]|uniref:DUF2599 domain-containing protein n=1 Tax=unclassified Pseudomonas TaxID=196821 RepID=UPI001906DB47|nr:MULTISPECIES: DUF2599 domain-containing protein [unclassified Pseudomonas]MBJ9976452.1 DUF2599 domain-containing protein [Pseudomonas sp. S30]MBK0155648.1 DUF2599 domain-containing protein [Pseudomonas sp. S75]
MKRSTAPFLLALSLPVYLYAGVSWADQCETVAKEVTGWYEKTVNDCGRNPAVDCSGVMIRGTKRADPQKGERYDVWNPSPASEKSGGVSVSWMRADKIGYEDPGLGYTDGMIFTPRDYVAKGQKKLDVYCAFPVDAWTDDRDSRGCGDNRTTQRTEASCQSAKLMNASDWRKYYDALEENKGGRHRRQRQCAFDMNGRLEASERRDAFSAFIKARQSIADTRTGREVQTELRLVSWKADEPVPIAAFFYSESKGLGAAQRNQQDYYAKTGNWVPVMRMDFPRNASSKTRFSCESNAQYLSADGKRANDTCSRYVDSAEWVRRYDPGYRKNIWTLSVKPTRCGRNVDRAGIDAMYAELKSRYGNDERWKSYDKGSRSNSMHTQLACHVFGKDKVGNPIRYKSTYNLEPARPFVTEEQAEKVGCNPV